MHDAFPNNGVKKEGRLTLSFLHPEDVGDYSCTATNAHGNNTRSVYLEVRFLLGGKISDTDTQICAYTV